MLSLGIPKELKPGERRVSLTPQGTKFLHDRGVTIFVEENAGLLSGFSNQDYESSGAVLISNSRDLWDKACLIKKVKEPISPEFSYFTDQHIIFAYLHLASPSARPLIQALQKAKATAIAYETIEKDNDTPLLKPMSEVAGILAAYYGVIFQKHIKIEKSQIKGIPEAKAAMAEAASHYPKVPHFKYRGRVLILGGGHVGKNAAEMVYQMGGEVWISEISEMKRNQLANNFKSRNLKINMINPANLTNYQECLMLSDVIISAVHSAGKRAPIVIDEELLKLISLRKKKIILDVAIDQGGNVAESKPSNYENILDLDSYGNLRFSVTNIPAFCGRGSSIALEEASLEYTHLLTQGVERAIQICPELSSGINLLKGEIVHLAVSEAHHL